MTIKLNRISQLFENIFNKGFFHLLFANFIIGFLGFGSQLIVAKFLTPLELGQIKTIQSFVGVGIILAGFGFNTAVLKLCSEKRSFEERSVIFKQNFYYTIVPIMFVLGIFFVLAKTGFLSPDKTVNKWFPLYMLVIPAMTYTLLIMVYLQALKKIQLMAKVQVIIRLFSFVGLIVSTYFYGFVGFILATIIVGYFALVPLLNLVKGDFKKKVKTSSFFSQSFFYAKWSVAGNVVGSIGQYMDIFMLNYLIKDRVSFGYYSLSTIFILGLNYITTTVQSIATPYFSEKSNDKLEFLRVLKKYEKLMILLTLGIVVLSFLVVPPFIRIVYGDSYNVAGLYFRILLVKYFFWSCYSLLGVAIFSLGMIKYNFFSACGSITISGVLNYIFIIRYGMIGAAVAQGITYFITSIFVILITIYILKRYFKKKCEKERGYDI